MMKFAMHIVALIVLPAAWLAASHAQDPAGAELQKELSRQDSIYRSTGEKAVEGYTIDRSLTHYTLGLPSGFDRALATLGPKDRWLDVGAGQGQAILDYQGSAYSESRPENVKPSGGRAQAVAMSIEDRRTPRWHEVAATLGASRLQYAFGKRLREYSVEELGRFQLITDVIGGFSYTENLSMFMEKILGLLELNGNFYTVLQDVNPEAGGARPHYAGAPFLTEIVGAGGSEMKVCAWLKRIACAEVTCEARPNWQPPMEAFRVRKVCDEVSVPNLAPVHYTAGTPPERRFQIRK